MLESPYGETAMLIAGIVTAAAAAASTAYTISKGSPDTNFAAPSLHAAPPVAPNTPPPVAPDTTIAAEDAKARQRAAQKVRELSQQQSAPSSILSAPLGVSAPSGGPTTVLGR